MKAFQSRWQKRKKKRCSALTGLGSYLGWSRGPSEIGNVDPPHDMYLVCTFKFRSGGTAVGFRGGVEGSVALFAWSWQSPQLGAGGVS